MVQAKQIKSEKERIKHKRTKKLLNCTQIFLFMWVKQATEKEKKKKKKKKKIQQPHNSLLDEYAGWT